MKLFLFSYMMFFVVAVDAMQGSLAKLITLQPTLKHIYRKPTDSEHSKGFHCYNIGSFKMYPDRFGNIVSKISPNLWVYALSSITDVHMGYVINNGNVLKNRHSFFPVNCEMQSFLEKHLESVDLADIIWKVNEDLSSCAKIAIKTKAPGKRKIPFVLNFILKKTIDGEILCLTAYPSDFKVAKTVDQSEISILSHLTELAEQQKREIVLQKIT